MTTYPRGYTCPRVTSALAGYVTGTHARAELLAVAAHLDACDRCAHVLAGLAAAAAVETVPTRGGPVEGRRG